MRRTPRPRASILALAVTLAALLTPSAAHAYERQWHAGLSFGYSYLATDPSFHGLGGALHLTYGINDMFNAMVQFDVTAHPSDSPLLIGSASAGIGYVVDILQVVPYVGVMVGAYDLWTPSSPCGADLQPSCHSARLGASLPFGLDYTVTRSFNIGFAGRYHLLFLSPRGGIEQMITAYARAEYVWGY
jgi:hypothetical protein